MEMVEVVGVAVGGQHHREIIAGGARYMVQEAAAWPWFSPIALNVDTCPIRQTKPGYVDRQPIGVFAELVVPAGIGAARIGPEMIDADDVMAKVLHRQFLQGAALERDKLVGKEAAHRRRAVERHDDLADPHRCRHLAARVGCLAHIDLPIGDPKIVEIGEAGSAALNRRRHVAAPRQRRGEEREKHGAKHKTRHFGIHEADGRSLL